MKVPELSSMPAEKTEYSSIYIGEDSVKKVVITGDGIMTISTLYGEQVPDEIYLYTSKVGLSAKMAVKNLLLLKKEMVESIYG